LVSKTRIGAGLLFVFLVLATYFFHDFWTIEDAQAQQGQMIHFMKNLALMGNHAVSGWRMGAGQNESGSTRYQQKPQTES